MFETWVIAYDVDVNAAKEADVTVRTIYNRIKACLNRHGFTGFTQLSIYALADEEDALVSIWRGLEALGKLPESEYLKRLHCFRVDGALSDVLPIVNGRQSFEDLDEDLARAA